MPAGTFTTTYNRYKLDFRAVGSSDSIDIDGRLRATGTDATGSDYTHQFLQSSSSSVNGQRSTLNRWYQVGGASDTTGESTAIFEILNPAQSVKTTAINTVSSVYGTPGSIQLFIFAYLHNLTTSYDSFSFFPSSGTITGTVSVYGYNK